MWWHRRWLWRLPLDYWIAAGASLALALVAQLLVRGEAGAGTVGSPRPGPLAAQALLLAAFVVWALLAGLLAPAYGRLYARTHAPGFDERGRVPITPPPGETSQLGETSPPDAAGQSPPGV